MARTCPTCRVDQADDVDACPHDGTPLPEPDPLIGRTIGSYRILKPLGKGGMGAVYLAQHPVIGSKVAIKFLHAQYSRDKRVVDRFFNEARAVNLIGHDNILKILDLNATDDGMHYFVMEFLEGRPLQGLIESRRKAIGGKWVPLEEAGPILLQLCAALHAAHEKGIVHRDLKPDNVFLVKRNGYQNVVKVVDFGIARLSDATGQSLGQTQQGTVMGTPAYMSPEQASGATARIDRRSDVYSMGVMAFQLCTGRLPFGGKSYGELLAQHLKSEPPRPRSLNPEIPEEVEEIILTCLRKRQEERFQSMAALATALRAALEAQGLPTEPPVDPDSDVRALRQSAGRGRGAADTLVDQDAVPGATIPLQAAARPGRRTQPRPAGAEGGTQPAGEAFEDELDPEAGTVPSGATPPESHTRPDTGPGGRTQAPGGRGHLSTAERAAGRPPTVPPQGAGRTPLLIAAAVLVAALVAVGLWLARGEGAAPAQAKKQKPPAAAPAAPAEVMIAVSSEPFGASVIATWPGGTGAGVTPFTLEAPLGATVELQLSLAGHVPATQTVLADRHRNVSVKLQAEAPPPPKEPTPAVAAPKPGPAKEPASGKDAGKKNPDALINPF